MQNTVESSTFWGIICSIANHDGFIIIFRYTLGMNGVPIEVAANVLCNNEYVYKNASFAEYQLKKNHQTVCFHQTMECMAADIIIVHRVNNNGNLEDMLTKSLPDRKCVQLRSWIMYSENPNIS